MRQSWSRFIAPVFIVIVSFGLVTLHGETASGAAPQSSAPGATQWGDANCDGSVSAPDVVPILRVLAEIPGAEPPCPMAGTTAGMTVGDDEFTSLWGDANCDEEISIEDAFIVLYNGTGLSVPASVACPALGAELDILYATQPVEFPAYWADLGDAPDGTETGYSTDATTGDFPTSTANGGPSHPSPFSVWLGEFETVEGQHAVPADDSDDGVQALDMPDCGDGAVLITVNFGGLTLLERNDPVYVNILGDWNRDGRWQGTDTCAGEWAVQNEILDISDTEPGSTLDTFVVDLPTGEQAQELWLRVTVSREQYDPAAGELLHGETEDYLVQDGQILHNPPEEAPLAAPRGIGEGARPAGPQIVASVWPHFYCEALVLAHGSSFAEFYLEQTRESKNGGFRIQNVDVEVSGSKKEDGTPGGAAINQAARLKVSLDNLNNGRQRLRLTTKLDTTADEPDRLEGPFLLPIALKGKDNRDKAFNGTISCVYWIDHTAGALIPVDATEQGQNGFTGGPGHTDSRLGVIGQKFIWVYHGQPWNARSDGAGAGGIYDPASVTVFGPDGVQQVLNPVPRKPKDPHQAPRAGIHKITPANNGRAIVIETIEDPPTPRVERLMVRVSGKLANQTAFVDYYRVVIVHDDAPKARVLEMLEGLVYVPDGHSQLGPGESFAVLYSTDNAQTLASRIPPDTAHGIDWPAAALCIAEPGTNFQAIMHGSTLFTVGYSGGGTDIFFLDSEAEPQGQASAPPDAPAPAQPQGTLLDFCTEDSRNITGGGPGNTRYWEQGAVCDGWIYAAELQEFALYRINSMTGETLPVPGGADHRYGRCAKATNGMHLLTGSTPANNGLESPNEIMSFVPCGGLCQRSVTGFEPFIPTAGAGEHILGAAISPDLSTVVYAKGSLSGSQIWAADFDENALTATNHRQLTTEGGNTSPAWSPDSQEIAFISSRDGFNEVYVMKADGSDERNVSQTPNVSEFTPSWQMP